MHIKKISVFCLLTFFFSSALLAKPTKLEMWHAMEGFIEKKLEDLIDKFNASQTDYEVHLTYKGNYTETFKAGVQAVKQKEKAPHILQVYEIATPTFRLQKDLYIPAHALLQKYGYSASQEGFIPAVIDFYADEKGRLLGLPFNISTGLLFYNKEAFQKAGLDPEVPPQTWEEVEAYSLKLKKAGYACGLTTAWPSGYLLEHFAARHNLPFATKGNGFQGKGAKLLVNAKSFVFNIHKFAEWQKKGIFQYAGKFVKEPEQLFTSGQCAIILQGTSRMVMLQKEAKFNVGVGPLPYWAALSKKPHNLVTGGAALWALKGHSTEVEKGIAVFFDFLISPKNQQYWAEATGYIPISKAAYQLSEKSGYYLKNLSAKIGIESLMLPATPYSKGIRVPGFLEVRDEALIPALEEAFAGKKSAKDALIEAVRKGNVLIRKAETGRLSVSK